MFLRNLWYVAAWSTELGSDGPIGRTITGEPVVLWRKSDGAVVALEDRCPHRHAPLSFGRVEGDTIRCMYHGLKFGCDGVCQEIPGTTVIPPQTTARAFPVVERSSWIWVWMGDSALANPDLIPEAFGLNDPNWVMTEGALDYEADYQLINDNLTDLSHLDFTHETTLGPSSGAKWSEDQPKVTTIDHGLLIDRWFQGNFLPPGAPAACDTFTSYRYLLPGLFIMSSRMYPPGTAVALNFDKPDQREHIFQLIEQQAVTPIGDGRSRYLFATGFEAKFASREGLEGRMEVVNAAFAEDRRMIEAQQKIWNATPPHRHKAFIPQDKAPAIFRRLIARRLAEEAGRAADAVAAE